MAREFLPWLIHMGPPGLRRFIVNILPWKALKEINGIIDIMDKISTEVFEDKKRALSEGDEAIMRQVGQGRDIMSTLRACMMISR
jgi:hypothetical protein